VTGGARDTRAFSSLYLSRSVRAVPRPGRKAAPPADNDDLKDIEDILRKRGIRPAPD
jgi:hypothetical protein